ncbi:MAG: Omp28-related outer membrane protein [Vicingaceae bacterium]
MKSRYFLLIALVISLFFVSCGKDEALTENLDYDEEATGEDPKIPVVSDTTNNNGTGNGSGNGGTNGGTDLVVENKQRAVITYVGATWCPPCGAYGDPTKKYIDSIYGDDAVVLNVQSNDAISDPGTFEHGFGNAFQSFVSSNSIPHIYWSGANFSMEHNGFFTSASSNNSTADAKISSIMANPPEVGVAAEATLSNDTVSIETLAKFYNVSTEAFIGVYLLEDSVMALQEVGNSQTEMTSHENVIRGAAYTSNTLGVESLGSAFNADEEVVRNFTIVVPNSVVDQNHLQVAVVIWESDQVDGISNAIIVDVE